MPNRLRGRGAGMIPFFRFIAPAPLKLYCLGYVVVGAEIAALGSVTLPPGSTTGGLHADDPCFGSNRRHNGIRHSASFEHQYLALELLRQWRSNARSSGGGDGDRADASSHSIDWGNPDSECVSAASACGVGYARRCDTARRVTQLAGDKGPGILRLLTSGGPLRLEHLC